MSHRYAEYENYCLNIMIGDDEMKKAEITRLLPPFIKHKYLCEQPFFDVNLHFQGTDYIAMRDKLLNSTSGICPLPIPLLLDQTSVHLNALNGLPGPFLPSVEKKLTSVEFYKLLDGFDDKSAEVRYVVGLMEYPSKKIRVFSGGISGTMVIPKDPNAFGWQSCFIPRGYGKPYGKLTEKQLETASYRRMSLIALSNYYRQDYDFIWNEIKVKENRMVPYPHSRFIRHHYTSSWNVIAESNLIDVNEEQETEARDEQEAVTVEQPSKVEKEATPHGHKRYDTDIKEESVTDEARDVAGEAKDAAGEAKDVADGAKDAAGEAKDVADGAKDVADGAKDVADGAKDAAGEAKDVADGAKDAAGEAKDVADGAKDVADGARDVTDEKFDPDKRKVLLYNPSLPFDDVINDESVITTTDPNSYILYEASAHHVLDPYLFGYIAAHDGSEPTEMIVNSGIQSAYKSDPIRQKIDTSDREYVLPVHGGDESTVIKPDDEKPKQDGSQKICQ